MGPLGEAKRCGTGEYVRTHTTATTGKSKEQAMEEYIAKVEQLKEKYCS